MAPPGSRNSVESRLIEEGVLCGPKNIAVLDGGFATQLGCHVEGPIDGDVLWSARFLATNPQAVIDTHLDFLRAGSDIILTNTYQASIGGFVEHLKVSETESYFLIKSAVQLAKTAVDRFLEEFTDSTRPKPLIAGSVGPYGASLHDGSEYTGAYAKTTPVEVMREWHRPRIEALVEGGVNILGLETIPCRAEAEMLVDLIKEYPQVKAWLTFSCRPDGKSIANGENFQDTAKRCYDLNPQQILAVGVNCLAPRLVESLFTGINKSRSSKPVPLIVYPNSGETYNVNLGWIDREKCEPLDSYIQKWLALGVTFVGGCCRTYAADISRIRNEVTKWQHAQKLQKDVGENGKAIQNGRSQNS